MSHHKKSGSMVALTRTERHWCQSLFFTAIVICLVLSNSFISTQAAQRFCGNNLSDALKLLCVDGYIPKLKRTGNANEVLTLDTSDFGKSSLLDALAEYSLTPVTNTEVPSPFVAFYGNMLSQYHHRLKRQSIGAYDECCRKPCSVAEMTAYCHVP